MRISALGLLGCCCLSIVLLGCSEAEVKQSEVQGPKAPAPSPPPPPDLGPMNLPYQRGGTIEVSKTKDGVEVKERVAAKVGVGKKGRRLEDERMVKMIVTPAIALFRTRERVVFEVQVPKAMQLYEALNGKKPATHEEFMEQIIQANNIPLPTLPDGQRYVYDPDTGQLMVERPAR